ncbi:hypothetical protein [Dokdonella sp.]|uniref:hypothetical protein n=1 Tax=Dokdonella sp. TaxID=2291710 RepID=UPI0031CBC698|nr:hypothetical protein [Dokdonella sp.]
MMRTALMLATLLALTACSGAGEPAASDSAAPAAAAADAPAEQAAATPRKTVFDEQLKALEKAKGVEKQLQDEKAKRDQELDAAGG